MFLPVPKNMNGMGYPLDKALEQTVQNLQRDLPWFVGAKTPVKKHFIIVGGGPSLLGQIKMIRSRRKDGVIVACNGAANVLIDHGIKPEFIAYMDPQPLMVNYVGRDVGSMYLVASMVHPSLLDALAGRKTILWHADFDLPEQRKAYESCSRPALMVGGGGTVSLRMLSLGFAAAYRSFHMYGVDSSLAADGSDHAYKKPDGVEPPPMDIMMQGKTYKCSPWMVRQVEDFKRDFVRLTQMGCRIRAHGEGLLPDVCREFNRAIR